MNRRKKAPRSLRVPLPAQALLLAAALCAAPVHAETYEPDTRLNTTVYVGQKPPATVKDSRTMVPTMYANGCVWDPQAREIVCRGSDGSVEVLKAGDNGDVSPGDIASGSFPQGNEMSRGTWGMEYPTGYVIAWPFAQNPPLSASGKTVWIECNGGGFDAAEYPKLAALLGAASVPDMRGLFLRGAGGMAFTIGRIQSDEAGAHSHALPTKDILLPSVTASRTVSGTLRDIRGETYSIVWSSIAQDGIALVRSVNLAAPDGRSIGRTMNLETRESRPANRSVRWFIRAED